MNADQDLYRHVENAIKAVLKVDGGSVSPATSLMHDLGAESIDFLDISCELEKLVRLEVNFRDLAKQLRTRTGSTSVDITVEDIVEYLRAKGA
jgi:acyl carrier protein